MISKEQFEAHVRAEAERKHPDAWIVADQSIIDHSDYRRTYITTRMEHEWPLVEALQGVLSLADVDADERSWMCRNALSPYTTKPTER